MELRGFPKGFGVVICGGGGGDGAVASAALLPLLLLIINSAFPTAIQRLVHSIQLVQQLQRKGARRALEPSRD